MKKSYLGFIIWLIAYSALVTTPVFLPIKDAAVLTRILLVFTAVAMVILMAMMYVWETVYWMSGVSYEQAVAAGSERRKRFAFLHLRMFGIYAVAYILFSVIAQFLHFDWWVDTVVFTVSLIVLAIFSPKYKL